MLFDLFECIVEDILRVLCGTRTINLDVVALRILVQAWNKEVELAMG